MTGYSAETILVGGVIPAAPEADSVAIMGGQIVALGREEDLERLSAASTRRVDLAGRTLLPGFIDSHTHLLETGLKETTWELDLDGLSRSEVLERLAAETRARGKGEWVIARGWDESRWEEHRYLGRRELDAVAPENPVVAVRIDGHLLAANALALERLPQNTDREKVDEASGLLWEEAASSLLRTIGPDDEALLQALRAAANLAHRLGVTSVHTTLRPERVPIYLRGRECVKLRIALCPEASSLEALAALGIESGFGDDWLCLGGVKVFTDGSIGARNAALSTPYEDSPGVGTLNYADEELVALVRSAEQAHLQTVIHAIGDRAIDQVLRAHQAAGSSTELRHRVEHFELATDEQIDRTKKLGLQISMQPNFAGNWSGEGRLYEERLGRERDRRTDPHRRVLDRGLRLAFGSDGMPFSPLYGLHWAVNAPHPGQRVTVEEGIACYTEAGAYLSFEEKRKGRISPGMLADLVVLDKDPRRHPDRIVDLQVVMTFVAGKLVFRREEGSCA